MALLKYPFYYIIRRGFGNFFGMIHVLTRHLAPELDRFRFCPGFWSMLYFGRKLDIFGDVSTHGHNWAKMRNKEKRPHAKDGTERGQKGPRPAGLGPSEPAGLAHSGAQSASIFFSVKYASTLICVLPKPPTRTAYIYPEAAVKEGDRREIRERASRDEFQRSIRVRHKTKATPEASSSLGAAASWRTARDPSLAGDFVTMIDYASLSFMG